MRSTIGSDAIRRILILESDSTASRIAIQTLSKSIGDDVDIQIARSGQEACAVLRTDQFDIILIDLDSLEDICADNHEAVERLCRVAGTAIIIALSNGTSVSLAVGAMHAGAHDYLPKPINGDAFLTRAQQLLQRHGKACAKEIATRKGTPAKADFAGFIGVSSQMRAVYEQISKIAPSAAPVFITGESGTGKEVCAEALHKSGPREAQPIIAVNCAAIPRDLMETELFGTARGAFTGATEDRKGAVELADGGTLFLDEIGEMDVNLQTKLLRFLQTNTVTRVGEGRARPVDVRVICATNRNPMQLIADRKFREDLFYRLHVLPIHLPPLRQRPDDILPLAQYFLERFAREETKIFSGINAEAAEMISQQDWRGNVRQLQNLMRRIVVMFDGGDVTLKMVLAADIENHAPVTTALSKDSEPIEVMPMWRQEQRIIENTILHFKGNISQAAAALEISPSTIYRKRQSWEQMEPAIAGAA